MPKAEYTYALDNENTLYACFGRTVKYKFENPKWVKVKNPDDYEFLFDFFSPAKIISTEEALKITKRMEPKDHFTVNRRVYLTSDEIDNELTLIMLNRKFSKETVDLVFGSNIDTRVLVLEWLIKNPHLHEFTIEVLVKHL